MTITLTHLALALLAHGTLAFLVCACVLIAPHNCRRTGVYGSIAFSLLAGVSMGAFVTLAIAVRDQSTEAAAPTNYHASIAMEQRQ